MVVKNVSYALVKEFENFLSLSTLDETTTPKKSEVEQFIHAGEREVETRTQHAWRDRSVRLELPFPEECFTQSRTHGYSLWFDGIEIPLLHRGIATLDATKGDELTIRQGGSRVDYIANKTEGVNQDYFLEHENGILHVYRRWAIQIHDKVRIRYRYGTKAEGTISSTGTGTSITVDTTKNFQPGVAYIAHDTAGTTTYEAVYVNEMSSTVLTVMRAQHGTSVQTLAADDVIWQVPEDISKAVVRLAVIEMAHNDTLMENISLGEGLDYEGIMNRLEKWGEEADGICERHLEAVRV